MHRIFTYPNQQNQNSNIQVSANNEGNVSKQRGEENLFELHYAVKLGHCVTPNDPSPVKH